MRLMAIDLACVRGGRMLYDGLSFSLTAGDAILVLGANGSGKTSLLRQIAGLLPLDAGSVAFEGGESISEAAHFVGHLSACKDALTVGENLAFWRDLYGRPRHSVEGALEMLRLSTLKDLPCRVLSAGQKRRLALSRLVAVERPLWLLDEPDAALDSEGRATLIGLINEHRARGGIAIIASHGTLNITPSREISLSPDAKDVAA
jgi:heme exporter protein A